MNNKKLFHLAPQQEIDQMIAEKKSLQDLREVYRQPDWCKYPGALHPDLGCWSLTDLSPNGSRSHISHEYCSQCECYTGDRPTYIDFESE